MGLMESKNQHSSGHRTIPEIIQDLERLVRQKGFVYTFSFNVITSLFTPPGELAEIDWSERPNNRELSFLLGLMVEHPLYFTMPDTKDILYCQNDKALKLLVELHQAHTFSNSNKYSSIQTGQDALDDRVALSHENWMASGQGLIEPIFYGREGADAFQFLRLAALRYQNDTQWIEDHLGISLGKIIAAIEKIRELVDSRFASLRPSDSFVEFCNQCMELFLFEPDDISNLDKASVQAFLEAFSFRAGEANPRLESIGAYNKIHSHPIIRLDGGKYFIPLTIYLSRSLYESPYYWMLNDSNYKDTSSDNRGVATEQIAYDLLKGVFGEANIFRNVKVRENAVDATDIDILVCHRDRVIVVQAKSKKLTVPSRMGNRVTLDLDFQEGVQDAYDQAVLSIQALTEKRFELLDGNGGSLTLNNPIREIYAICVTGDAFPALAIQLRNHLRKSANAPFPLAVSLFDLEILSHYLCDPFDFLYFLRQRGHCSEQIGLCSELALLSFHLERKLNPSLGRDVLLLDETPAQILEADYLVATGHWPETRRRRKLTCHWRHPEFDKIIHCVKGKVQQGLVDAIFFLYDIAGNQTEEFFCYIGKLQKATLRDGQIHDMSLPNSQDRTGISFISYPEPRSSLEAEVFRQHFQDFAISRKYRSHANEWMALASLAGTQNLIDIVWHSQGVWQDDPEVEKLAFSVLGQGKVLSSTGKRQKKKPSRNDQCPCGSGRKYKRCHGIKPLEDISHPTV